MATSSNDGSRGLRLLDCVGETLERAVPLAMTRAAAWVLALPKAAVATLGTMKRRSMSVSLPVLVDPVLHSLTLRRAGTRNAVA